MKYQKTIYANHYLILDEEGIPVAVVVNDSEEYHLYDRVQVTGDVRGYVTPGISKGGEGKIVEISNNHTDHFLGVLMDSGEFGFVKPIKVKVKATRTV